jgi:hypothetical protein
MTLNRIFSDILVRVAITPAANLYNNISSLCQIQGNIVLIQKRITGNWE